jgi:hypothetical protein
MDKSEQIMTRYLLGELSEPEQRELEERYFTDPQVFDRVLRTESELIDGYVRGQLSNVARERFEQSYLVHPERRERVKFAEALLSRLDQTEPPALRAAMEDAARSRWQRLLVALRGQRLAMGFAMALALLAVLGGLWFFIESQRLRRELAESQSARANDERRARELEQQLDAERKRAAESTAAARRAGELAAELERLRAQSQPPQTATTPPVRPAAPVFVTLLLTAGSVRGGDTGQPQTLVIPQGTAQARLQLNLKDNNYPSYRVSLHRVGGEETLNQSLKPRNTKAGALFVLSVPVSQLATGDYILTLRGVSQNGEIDDLSKSIFRVEKK